MKRSAQDHRGNAGVPTDPALIALPLDFICKDHFRERRICAEIDRLAATADFDRWSGMTVLRFLNEEVRVHIRNEAEDLFPSFCCAAPRRPPSTSCLTASGI